MSTRTTVILVGLALIGIVSMVLLFPSSNKDAGNQASTTAKPIVPAVRFRTSPPPRPQIILRKDANQELENR